MAITSPRPPLVALVALLALRPGPARSETPPETSEPATAQAPDAQALEDARLRGFVEAWLAFSRNVRPKDVRVSVSAGVVTLEGDASSGDERRAIVEGTAALAGVRAVVDRLGAAEPADGRWRGWIDWVRPPPGRQAVRFPSGDIFRAPLADQKQPRFHTTLQRYRTPHGTFDMASVGFGETFGLLRWSGRKDGDGQQLGLSGAVFALFNLDSTSFDLLNADYIIGLPWSLRRGPWSGRARLFHQSSHLGDEFLLAPQPGPPVDRINLSYEALEILASREGTAWRFYGGPTRIVHSATPLERDRLQLGAEFQSRLLTRRSLRFVGGIDVQAWEETRWDRDVSVKAGVRFKGPTDVARSLTALVEWYDGHSPHGQFYPLDVRYFGLGFAYSF